MRARAPAPSGARAFGSTPPAFPRLHGGVAWPSDAWRPTKKVEVPDDAKNFYTRELLEIPELAIPVLPPAKAAPDAPLLARATVSSFMPDHVSFYSFFAEHAARALRLPLQQRTPPPLLRRYRVNRSPFAQAKTKDLFERKVHLRVLEVRGTAGRAADAWEWWLRENAPPGVRVDVERWTPERVGFGGRMRQVEAQWRAENVPEGEEENGPETIDERLARPTDPASLVMAKVREILGKWNEPAKRGGKAKAAKEAAEKAAEEKPADALPGEAQHGEAPSSA
ncbi:hypothetical protein DFJ74DRAFT_702235 [Hyaloraphidium curvatum]|nr:hypothetical protein DFJ74DRAFT_702235 [Hyaloraphidium curvatum]